MDTTKTVYQCEEQFRDFMMKRLHQDPDTMSEEEKSQMRSRIEAKLRAGKKLSPEEVRFLQQTDPQGYLQYMRIQQLAQALKSQLQHARTKSEANRIIAAAMGAVSDKDPAKEYIIAAMNKVAIEFKSSQAYKKLPETEAELAKQKNKKPHPTPKNEDKDEVEDEDPFDPMDWSPLQDVIDGLPTFDHPV
ncbi:MAG: hypothetical protein K5819_01155 [Lachnospiraceae bacterium]|nr:hypothetical protein [Lachnospiraceae bacterium]